MSKVKEYTYREAEKILINNGYELKRRGKGDHNIFTNGVNTISIPCIRNVNRMMFKRLVKENGLIVD